MIDNILYSKDETTIIRCPTGRKESVDIIDSVTRLDTCAFEDCSKLTEIKNGNNITTIDRLSFYKSGLNCISIKNNVNSIGKYAFEKCTQLNTVVIDSASIANNLTSLTSAGYIISNAETIYIKSDITEIGSYITDNYQIIESDKEEYVKYLKK